MPCTSWARTAGEPNVLTFCLDDNYGWDDGLICGGRMTILADAAARPTAPARLLPPLPISDRRGAGLHRGRRPVRVGRRPAGRQPLPVRRDGRARRPARRRRAPGTGRPATGPARTIGPARRHTADAPSCRILPRVTLLIVGGGHVGQAVARLAAEVDFDVWVVDDRDATPAASAFRRPSAGSSATSAGCLKELARCGSTPPPTPSSSRAATATTRRRCITWPRRRPATSA